MGVLLLLLPLHSPSGKLEERVGGRDRIAVGIPGGWDGCDGWC